MKKYIIIIVLLFLFLGVSGCKHKEDNYVYYNDLSYGTHKRQKLDLYIPNDMKGNEDGGLVLYIHGGAWVAGDKDGYRDEMKKNAQDGGYSYAAINYRYIDDDTNAFDILNDIFYALEKIKEVALENGVKLTKVLLTGGSAGGHLALLYAYSFFQVDPFYSPILPTCVVSYSGPTNITSTDYYTMPALSGQAYDLFSKLSGYKYNEETYNDAFPYLLKVSPTFYAMIGYGVPTVICHGEQDTVVPVSDAIYLDHVLNELNVSHDLVLFPHSDHGLESDPDKWEYANKLFKEYMKKYL